MLPHIMVNKDFHSQLAWLNSMCHCNL